MYGGQTFHDLMEEEPGTYFLTDFLVRGFRGTILKGMGLDKYPQLKDDYFRNYKRIVYLEQKHDPALVARRKKRPIIWNCRWKFGTQATVCWKNDW